MMLIRLVSVIAFVMAFAMFYQVAWAEGPGRRTRSAPRATRSF